MQYLSPNNNDLYTLHAGFHHISLDDSRKVWRVIAGEVSIFAVSVASGKPQGRRQYLFTVWPGEVLWGLQAQALGLIAVALEESTLQPLAAEELASMLSAGDWESVDALDRWLGNLSNVLLESLAPPQKSKHRISKGTSKLVWANVYQKNVCWLGEVSLLTEKDPHYFPLPPGSWLEDSDTEKLQFSNTDALDADQIESGIGYFHQHFLLWLESQQAGLDRRKFRLFKARESMDADLSAATLTRLASILEVKESAEQVDGGLPWQKTFLFALGAVAKAARVEIKLPSSLDLYNDSISLLFAIARTSNFRVRKINLSKGWNDRNYGPLLVFLEERLLPAAAIPAQKRSLKYVLKYADEIEGEACIPVRGGLIENIDAEAYLIYRAFPLDLKNSVRSIQFGIQGYGRDLRFILILGILSTLLGMLPPYVTGILVSSAIPDSDRLLIYQIGLSLLFAAFGQAIFQLSQSIAMLRVEGAMDGSIQLGVWDKLLKLPPAFFRQYTAGDLANRLFSIREIRNQLSGGTQRVLLSGIFSILNLGIMLAYSPRLSILSFSILLLAALFIFISGSSIAKGEGQKSRIDGEIYGKVIQIINGIAKIRATASEHRFFANWVRDHIKRMEVQSKVTEASNKVFIFNEMLAPVSSMLLFWLAASSIQPGELGEGQSTLEISEFLAFSSAFTIFVSGIVSISSSLPEVTRAVVLWNRMQGLVKTPAESESVTRCEVNSLDGEVRVENVTFRYSKNGPAILECVSLYASPGEFVAIAGPSGAGKSTVLRLLLGFENSASGSIYYDGKDINNIDLTSLRKHLGTILQNSRVQQGTIFENISGGALISLEEAWEAAKAACLHEDIASMPMKMYTEIGEGGGNLSGGQRQRLLIARALVKKPSVLLFDEATSALDSETQAIITKNIENLSITRIVIAHRLSTIRKADRIYVLDSGQIVQVGTFDELGRQEGLFTRLASRQLR